MEDKVLRERRKSFVAISTLATKFLHLPRIDMSENASQESVPHVEPLHAGSFIFAKCLQNVIDYGLISGTCTSSTSIARPRRQSS